MSNLLRAARTLAIVAWWAPLAALGQTVIFSQGFETTAPCTNWGYTGGNVNNQAARTGTYSARVGRSGESNTIVFNTVDVTGLAGLQLRFYHHVRTGAGPGMDTDEGAVVQVRINGGGWTTIEDVSGYGDYNWAWTAASGGNPGNGCGYTMPNPMNYTLPAGTNTFALRIFSTRGGCPAGTATTYDRTDEGLFIDDVQLTTTTNPLPFIWSGTVDTDWHKCRNWRYGVVPVATSAVQIDQTAANDCEVYTNNAVCASLSVSTNSTTVRDLTVRSGRQLVVGGAVGGPVTVTRTGAGAAIGITLGTVGTGILQCGSFTLSGSGAGNASAYLRNEAGTNGLLVLGDLTINNGGLVDLNPGGVLQLRGNWTNNDGEAAFDDASSLVWFSGTAPQAINTNGFTERFGSLRMGKTASDLTLNDPISIRAALMLAAAVPGGRIFSSSAALLSMENGSAATTATDGSHVNGPVQKFGTTDFIYPIGKDGVWRPVELSAVTGSPTDAFTAEYVHVSARIAPHSPLVEQPPLHHISDCEYWTIERSSGTPSARVELSWHNVFSCGVTFLADLRVARWDDVPATPLWVDRGNDEATTTPWGGWVSSIAGLTEFGSFSLSSISDENPLPIELVSFDAQVRGGEVLCTWVTASERDNDHFVVERSRDGSTFLPIGTVAAVGNSSSPVSYGYTDPAPFTGVSYYRLRQVDVDGATTTSRTVPVRMDTEGIIVRVDAGEVSLVHGSPDGTGWRIFDTTGRLLHEGRTSGSMLVLPRSLQVPMVHLVVLGDGASRQLVKVLY